MPVFPGSRGVDRKLRKRLLAALDRGKVPLPLSALQKAGKRLAVSWCGAVAQLGERDVRNVEVRGSIPLGSTSLRSLSSEARLATRLSRRSFEEAKAGESLLRLGEPFLPIRRADARAPVAHREAEIPSRVSGEGQMAKGVTLVSGTIRHLRLGSGTGPRSGRACASGAPRGGNTGIGSPGRASGEVRCSSKAIRLRLGRRVGARGCWPDRVPVCLALPEAAIG